MDVVSDEELVRRIRKWAEGMVNCSHELCSIAESHAEEKYGEEVLDILEGGGPKWLKED